MMSINLFIDPKVIIPQIESISVIDDSDEWKTVIRSITQELASWEVSLQIRFLVAVGNKSTWSFKLWFLTSLYDGVMEEWYSDNKDRFEWWDDWMTIRHLSL